ncbi:hypothetical protein NDU88_004024 [Pleurodeles waltl]|uniref:Uncharacterized protein n=1 Tax=Pleurodeles waltl TaxID=8319 RepID=A0AAV7V428_PLEWA|nr:hypothetical protein NDU88_004024 [Pleurodeles waltl]
MPAESLPTQEARRLETFHAHLVFELAAISGKDDPNQAEAVNGSSKYALPKAYLPPSPRAQEAAERCEPQEMMAGSCRLYLRKPAACSQAGRCVPVWCEDIHALVAYVPTAWDRLMK